MSETRLSRRRGLEEEGRGSGRVSHRPFEGHVLVVESGGSVIVTGFGVWPSFILASEGIELERTRSVIGRSLVGPFVISSGKARRTVAGQGSKIEARGKRVDIKSSCRDRSDMVVMVGRCRWGARRSRSTDVGLESVGIVRGGRGTGSGSGSGLRGIIVACGGGDEATPASSEIKVAGRGISVELRVGPVVAGGAVKRRVRGSGEVSGVGRR